MSIMNIDDPIISLILFHPRGEESGREPQGIPTDTASGSARISGYLHPHPSSRNLLLYFHGNGEIAADYDSLAAFYVDCGASFWVVDYRGYGRSAGTPCFSNMMDDAEVIFNDIPRLAQTTRTRLERVFVMGRSLGSAPAIYLASVHTEQLEGLLLDSPFADGPGLIRRLGGPSVDTWKLRGLVDNLDRMERCTLPTLIIHGTEDHIIPLSDAKALYASCRSVTRRLVEISGAGHNDLLLKGFDTYFSSVREHIARISG